MFGYLLAESTGSSSGGNSKVFSTIFIVLIVAAFVAMMIFNSRSQKKRQQESQKMLDAIKPGSKVKTIGGICGVVVEVNAEENTFVLETGTEASGKSLQEIYMTKLTEGKEIAVAEALTPSQPQITPYDEQFMQKVMEFIEEQMDNAELTIDEFAEHLMLSRTIFYRKLKSIIGLTPVDFIREVRIKRAAQLIDSGEYNFSQVAYMTGFNDPKYFSKCFKKVVGITSSEYKEKNK